MLTKTKQRDVTLPPSSVLVELFELPADLGWFNNLTWEERDTFLKGLLIVVASPSTERQRAIENHLRHWQIAMDVAARAGKPVLDVIRVYQPKPSKTAFQHFADTVHELRSFETKYGIPSKEFYDQFQSALISEVPWDYFEWRIAYHSFLHMKEQYGFSEEDVCCPTPPLNFHTPTP